MRRIVLCVAVLFAAVVGARAAVPTYAADDAVYEWERDTAISTSTSFDSLEGDSDTVTILDSTWVPDKQWEYILVRDAFVASGDSVDATVQVDCFQGSTLYYSVAVDSFIAEEGEAVHIPIGGTCLGDRFRIRAIAYAGNGAKTVFNRLAMYRRRAITTTRAR